MSSSSTSNEREKEQAKYKKTCDAYVDKGLRRDPTIKFLIDRLVQMGCEPPKGFIKCMDCGDRLMGGGFGVVEETVIQSSMDDDAKRRAEKAQCLRTEDDLKAQLKAQKEGKVQLRLLPEIFLCQQHLRNETHAHQSLAHELIHAIDLCR